MPRLTMPQYRGAGARTGFRRRFHSPAGPAGRGAWLSPLTTVQPCNHCLGLGQVWCVIPSIISATMRPSLIVRPEPDYFDNSFFVQHLNHEPVLDVDPS
jgi:hypothetical protein